MQRLLLTCFSSLSRRNTSGPPRRFTISNYNDYALYERELLFLLADDDPSRFWERSGGEERREEKGRGRERKDENRAGRVWIPPSLPRPILAALGSSILPGVRTIRSLRTHRAQGGARFDSPRANIHIYTLYSKRSLSLSLLQSFVPSLVSTEPRGVTESAYHAPHGNDCGKRKTVPR